MVKISKKTNDIASTESTQEIQISSFRSDWKILALKDAVEYIDYGYSQAIPKVPPENGIKIVSTADINRDGELLYSQIRKVEAPLKTIARLTLRDGDVLFNWRNSANLIGKTTVFEEQLDPHIFASFILRLRCDEIISHNYYIKHLLNYFRYRGIFENLARRAVNQANYNKNEISVLKIPIPPIEEQRKIARVLYLVQDAIAQQEQLLTLTTELKKALMQKLFTEGTRGESQKMTEIGLIPESWDVVELQKISKIERGKFSHRPRNDPRFYGGDIPFVQTGDVSNCDGRIRTYSQTLNQEGLKISKMFAAGTILITIAANIGFSGILEFDSACPDSLIGLTPKTEQISNEFLQYFLCTQQPLMDRMAPRGTQKNINIQFLQPWKIVIPPQDEQLEIVNYLLNIDLKLTLIKRKKEQLQDLFRTLLHQLMTAQIRVDDLNLSALNLEPQGGNE